MQVAIGTLTWSTAIIHLNAEDFAPFDLFAINSFVLAAVGYVVLGAALYLPIAVLERNRRRLRWLLIAYTAALVVGWIDMGQRTTEAYITKAIELALVALLLVEDRQTRTPVYTNPSRT